MFFAPPKEIIPDLQRQNNFSPYGNDHVYCDFKYHSIQLYVTRMVNVFCDNLYNYEIYAVEVQKSFCTYIK